MALCPYDINQINSRQVHGKLAELDDTDQVIDWSDGQKFPWWVWLANMGRLRDVANDAVYKVRVEVTGGRKYVVVESETGRHYLYSRRNGKMGVWETPPPYTG